MSGPKLFRHRRQEHVGQLRRVQIRRHLVLLARHGKGREVLLNGKSQYGWPPLQNSLFGKKEKT